MPGAIFIETLRRNWRQVLYWGLGLGLLGYYVQIIVPNVDALNEYAQLLATLPPVMLQMLGIDGAAAIAKPEGFIGLGFFTYALIVMIIYGVLSGMNITASEEDAGILDVLLSLPVPRWRLIVERFAAYVLITTGIAMAGFAGLIAGGSGTALPVNPARLLSGSLNLVPAVLLVIAFTACMAALTRRRALPITILFLVASYFIDFLASATTHALTDALSKLSFFTYYDAQNVMIQGVTVGNVAVLLAAALVLIAAALWFFQRRDIGG